MTYKIAIPFYANVHLLRNLMKQMDIDWRHIVLVDNSPKSEAKEFEGKGANILYYPENIGVAKSWNLALKADCDWTFFVSVNVGLPSGFSEVLAELNKANEWCLLSDLAWHCNAISKKTVNAVGYFDENFYPAYYEDTDYYYRMRLAGIPGVRQIIPAATMRQGNSLEGGLPVHFMVLAEYYKQKWGGAPGYETYKTPFNRPNESLHYWVGQALSVLKQRQNEGKLEI